MRGRSLEKWLCWEAATAERVAPAKSKAMTSLDLNTFEDYIKCKDEQSGVEFQVKYLLHSGTVYFEFSCGCSFKDDDSMNPLFTNGFFYFFTQGLLNGFRGKYQRKNKSIWNSDDFRKTPHLCCPKDPHLLHLLIEMLRNSRTKIVKAAAAFKNAAIIRKVARSKHAVQFKTAAGIHRCVSKKLKETMLKLNDPAFDFSFIAKDYLMPVFKNTAAMPNVEILQVQFFKDTETIQDGDIRKRDKVEIKEEAGTKLHSSMKERIGVINAIFARLHDVELVKCKQIFPLSATAKVKVRTSQQALVCSE